MAKQPRYSPEVRERAVRLLREQRKHYDTEWAAISSIASKIGCTAETLRLWVCRVERDAGERAGVTTEEQQRLKLLERENCELRRANDILRKAAAHFAQVELDRRGRVMVAFIDTYREDYGVAPLCAQLPIAPSTCYEAKARAAYATRRPARGARVRTTIPDAAADAAQDLVDRDFTATQPNQLWVADLPIVATWRGMVCVAFVIDVFSRRIVSWRASASMRTDLALDALEQASYDRGSQYLSIRYSERMAASGIEASVGSRGDAYECEHSAAALCQRLTPITTDLVSLRWSVGVVGARVHTKPAWEA